MKISKKIKNEILSAFRNLNQAGSFTSPSKLKNSLGLKKISIKDIQKILSSDPAYVSHRRSVKKFHRRKFVAPTVKLCVFE